MASPIKPRRKQSKSPTSRSLDWLRDRDYIAGVVERTLPKCFIKKDLFGWCDIIAVPPWSKANSRVPVETVAGLDFVTNGPTVYVQTTTGDHHADRRQKVIDSPEARAVLAAGNAIWVLTWRKNAKGRWQARVEEITLTDFPLTEAP